MLGAVVLCSNPLNLFSGEEAEVHLRWQSRDWNPGLDNLMICLQTLGISKQPLSHAH